MDMNITLIFQMVVFVFFIWATLRFIWPPLMKALETRRKIIADGLAAAEQGKRELSQAEIKAAVILKRAKEDSTAILEVARERANQLIETAKINAIKEGERLQELAKKDIALEYEAVKKELMQEVSHIAVLGTEKILQKEIDQASNDRLVAQLISEIGA